jgi:hypothetical protein
MLLLDKDILAVFRGLIYFCAKYWCYRISLIQGKNGAHTSYIVKMLYIAKMRIFGISKVKFLAPVQLSRETMQFII